MTEEKIKFDTKFALKNWRLRYDEDEEVISRLRIELEDCERKSATYPHTIRHIKEMLMELGVEA